MSIYVIPVKCWLSALLWRGPIRCAPTIHLSPNSIPTGTCMQIRYACIKSECMPNTSQCLTPLTYSSIQRIPDEMKCPLMHIFRSSQRFRERGRHAVPTLRRRAGGGPFHTTLSIAHRPFTHPLTIPIGHHIKRHPITTGAST
jgi:hypothetical protein